MLKIAFLRVWPVFQSLPTPHSQTHTQWSFHIFTYPSNTDNGVSTCVLTLHKYNGDSTSYRLHKDSGVSTCVLTHHRQTAEFPQSRASIGDTWPSHSPHPASTWQLPRYSVPRSSARSHVRYQEGGLVLQCSGPPSPRHSSKCDWHWYSCVFLSVLLGWSHLQNVFWEI